MLYKKQPEINKHFNTNWTFSPVEYEGLRFETPAGNKWISLMFMPEYEEEGVEGGLLKIVCYSNSATKAFRLADEVKTFLDKAFISDVALGVGHGDGMGCLNLENGVYQTVVLFDIITADNKC